VKRILLAALVLTAATSFQAEDAPAAKVSVIGDGSKESTAVRVFRYASAQAESRIRLGDPFSAGDQLEAVSDIRIELTCAKGAQVKLSGRFRVLISAPKDKSAECAINLLAGQADVIANNPTAVESGERTAGSHGTVYTIRVVPDAQGATMWCSVFDGEVEVREASGERARVPVGSKLGWKEEAGIPQSLSSDEIRGTAELYARMDVIKAALAGAQSTPTAAADLDASYVRVFGTPNDAEARIELAARETNLKLHSGAFYQLDRAEKLAAKDKPQLARIAAVRSVVYQESGQTQKAEEEAIRATKIDPNLLKTGGLTRYNIDLKRIPISTRASTSYSTSENKVATNTASSTSSSAATTKAPTIRETPPAAASSAANRVGGNVASAAKPPDADALNSFVARGQYAEAAAGFVSRYEQLGGNAKDAYGAAILYAQLKQRDNAVKYATLAMDANDKKKQLTADELNKCRDIRAAR
jgi:hypothetical protein